MSNRTNKAKAAKNGLTLREAAFEEATPRTRFAGSVGRIADEIERWFRDDVADGFILNVGFIDSLTDFVSHVLPLLRRQAGTRERAPSAADPRPGALAFRHIAADPVLQPWPRCGPDQIGEVAIVGVRREHGKKMGLDGGQQ